MEDREDDLTLSDEEEAAGFSIQTLAYPENYELPGLGGDGERRLERAVALEIDEENRFKRRQSGDGYVLEVFDGDEWCAEEEFETLDEVLDSAVYGRWKVEASAADDAFGDDAEPEEEF
ncbi:MAG: hypothetical protein FJ225_04895 [Lentisphaerae bacterium]|nr:hypothetical protein [Lentisphaerota bacterium]